MKTAIISDVHGNIQALDAVLEDVVRQRVDDVYCLGDIVGYAAGPGECVRRVRDLGIPCVMGNHDEAVVGKYDNPELLLNSLKPEPRIATEWTVTKLSEREIGFLRNLPYKRDLGNLVMTHSNIINPGDFKVYVRYKSEQVQGNLEALKEGQKLFIGHTHKPWAVVVDGGVRYEENPEEVYLDSCIKAIFNVGSVGWPRTDDRKACYVVFDGARGRIVFRRVEYDVEAAAEAIRASGIDKNTARTLASYLLKKVEVGKA